MFTYCAGIVYEATTENKRIRLLKFDKWSFQNLA